MPCDICGKTYAHGHAARERVSDAKALGEALDQLNEEIREVEHFIEDLGIGEAAEVPLLEGRLSFKKTDGAWCLMYMSPDMTGPALLTRASKQVRLEACKVMPQLLVAIREAGVSRFAEVREAIGMLRKFRGVTHATAPTTASAAVEHYDLPTGPTHPRGGWSG